MFNLNAFLTNEYKNEYGKDYLSPMKKKYSEPSIFTAKGDLSKRWYVYYRFRNPKTDELQKMASIYLHVNTYKTKAERLQILTSIQKNLSKLLKEGYNPFEDNQELYNSQIEASITPKTPIKVPEAPIEAPKKTIAESMQFVMDLKKKSLKDTSYSGLNNRINNFLDWLTINKPQLKHIDQIDKKTINDFLNYMLDKTSAGNRNNFRTDLSSVFQILEDNELIDRNFIKSTSKLKSIPTRHKTYTNKQLDAIFSHLEQNDEMLLLYIKFISYTFLRPIEIIRLKIGDINIEEKNFPFESKTNPLKTKIIPQILLKELPDLSNLNKDHFLFTPEKIGGEWDSSESNKRNYFSKRFKKVVKDHFNLGEEYGLYSFRHSYITILYQNYSKTLSDYETKAKLLPITGHSSMAALEKYLRTIDASRPEDYSDKFNIPD